MASEVKFDLRIEISNLNYHGIYVHVASNYHFGGLWGHGGLKTSSMASELKFDLTFEISNLNYPGIIVHMASNSHFGGLWGHGGLQTASEVIYGLIIKLSDLTNLCCHASMASKCLHELNAT